MCFLACNDGSEVGSQGVVKNELSGVNGILSGLEVTEGSVESVTSVSGSSSKTGKGTEVWLSSLSGGESGGKSTFGVSHGLDECWLGSGTGREGTVLGVVEGVGSSLGGIGLGAIGSSKSEDSHLFSDFGDSSGDVSGTLVDVSLSGVDSVDKGIRCVLIGVIIGLGGGLFT